MFCTHIYIKHTTHRWCTGQNKRTALSQKATKGLTALTPEIDCDQTAMDLPPVTSAVFLIAN
jgi:hypothetical protein